MEDVQKAIIATICILVLAGGGTLNNISERANTNGEEIDENRVSLRENSESLMVQSSNTENLSAEVELLKSGPNWVNVVSENDLTWSISLNDSQWLEVKSSRYIFHYQGNDPDQTSNNPLYISEAGGYYVSTGMYSPIFGGTYSVDLTQNIDEDYVVQRWSIIYRIHEV